VKRVVALAVGLVAAACAVDNPTVEPAALDEAMFRCRVEPVLVERCAFPACHGAADRPFRLHGPGRTRLEPAGQAYDAPMSEAEHRANWVSALGFATPAPGYDEALLVEKPLAPRLGGAYHGANRMYGGQAPFQSDADPGLMALRVWLDGAREEASCDE
jgi:hypothetical protein